MTRAWRFLSSPVGVAVALLLILVGLFFGERHFVFSVGGATVIPLLVLAALGLGTRCLPRLHFQQFGGGPGTDGAGRPALLRALVRAELHRLVTEEARLPGERPLRLDHAGPYEDSYNLESVGDGLSPLYKALSAVTGQLIDSLSSRARLVNGFLVPAATAILSIETVRGQPERMGTIAWDSLRFPPLPGHGDPDSPDDLVQLAMPAAAWILLARHADARLGGTSDWASYVAFTAGCAWEARGALVKAQELYRAACADPANLAATVNLARLERLKEEQDVAQGAPAKPVSRLDSVQRLRTVVGDQSVKQDDPQWFRGRYLLSMILRDVVDDQFPAAPTPIRPQPVVSLPAGPSPAGPSPVGSPPVGPTGGPQPVRSPAPAAAPATVPADAAAPDLSPADLAAVEARKDALEVAGTIVAGPGPRPGGVLPAEFYANARAAALTLVARQAVVVPPDLSRLSFDKHEGPGYQQADIPWLIARIQSGDIPAGAPELLERYVRSNLQLDDQSYYNLARLHHARAKTCAAAIERWDEILLGYAGQTGNEVRQWLEDVQQWQDVLEKQYRGEVRRARRYQQLTAEATTDNVLAGLAQELPPLPSWTTEGEEAWHHEGHGPPGDTVPSAPPATQPPLPAERPFQGDGDGLSANGAAESGSDQPNGPLADGVLARERGDAEALRGPLGDGQAPLGSAEQSANGDFRLSATGWRRFLPGNRRSTFTQSRPPEAG